MSTASAPLSASAFEEEILSSCYYENSTALCFVCRFCNATVEQSSFLSHVYEHHPGVALDIIKLDVERRERIAAIDTTHELEKSQVHDLAQQQKGQGLHTAQTIDTATTGTIKDLVKAASEEKMMHHAVYRDTVRTFKQECQAVLSSKRMVE